MARCHDNRRRRIKRRRREEKRLAARRRGWITGQAGIWYNGVYLGIAMEPPTITVKPEQEYDEWTAGMSLQR